MTPELICARNLLPGLMLTGTLERGLCWSLYHLTKSVGRTHATSCITHASTLLRSRVELREAHGRSSATHVRRGPTHAASRRDSREALASLTRGLGQTHASCGVDLERGWSGLRTSSWRPGNPGHGSPASTDGSDYVPRSARSTSVTVIINVIGRTGDSAKPWRRTSDARER